MQFVYGDEIYQFLGVYALPKKNAHFLNNLGQVQQATCDWLSGYGERAIVHRVPRYHDLGGVRYVETGEKREMGRLEVATDRMGRLHCPVFSDEAPAYGVFILRPVEVL